MKKILAATLAAVLASTAAHADWRGPRPGYGYGHEYRGGGGGNWAAPLVGGLIIGGMLGAMGQQRYEEAPPYHVECRWERLFDAYGNYIGNGRRCYNIPNY